MDKNCFGALIPGGYICICCVPGSAPPSTSASAVSVHVPDLSALPSLRHCLLSLPVPVSVPVPGSSASLSVSAVCLGPFLRLHLHLLCLCLCLICVLLRRFVCDCAWVVRSSICVCCVPGSVLLSASASAVCLCLCLVCQLLCLCLLYLWLCQKR